MARYGFLIRLALILLVAVSALVAVVGGLRSRSAPVQERAEMDRLASQEHEFPPALSRHLERLKTLPGNFAESPDPGSAAEALRAVRTQIDAMQTSVQGWAQ